MKLYPFMAVMVTVLGLAFSPGSFGAPANGLTNRDIKFIRTAAQGLLFEIETGQLAQAVSSDTDVLAFAERMVTDHSADLQALQVIANNNGITLPTTPGARLEKELARLRRLTGSQFDREYISFEIGDHRLSLREYSGETVLGFDFEVRGFAAERVPVLLAHLELAYEVAVHLGLIDHVPGGPAPATARLLDGRVLGSLRD